MDQHTYFMLAFPYGKEIYYIACIKYKLFVFHFAPRQLLAVPPPAVVRGKRIKYNSLMNLSGLFFPVKFTWKQFYWFLSPDLINCEVFTLLTPQTLPPTSVIAQVVWARLWLFLLSWSMKVASSFPEVWECINVKFYNLWQITEQKKVTV